MRRPGLALVFFFCLLWPVFAFAAEPAPAVLLTAQQIDLYAERRVLVAAGGVALHAGALQITATRAAFDMRDNRFTAAGDVVVNDGTRTLEGSGYVYDFTAGHGEIVSNAVVPELPREEALASASQVELHPRESIVFSNAQVRTGSTFAPQASFVYAIPPPDAKNFGGSPVPSAALEWPFVLGVGSDAYTFARVRYDKYNGGPGTGFEEHYARTDRGYAALGETMDVDGTRFDLASYQRLNDRYTQTLNASMLAGTHTFRYALAWSGSRGYASLSTTQFNAERSDELLFSGNQRRVGALGSARLQAVFGHDVHPGDAQGLAQDWRVTPGLHYDTPTVRAGRASLAAAFDLGENIYTYGRGTLASTLTASGSVPVSNRLLLNGGVTFSHDAPPAPSTYRTYELGYTWKASDAFNVVSSLTYAHDYGQAFGTGRPVFGAAFDVRVRRRNGTGIEVGALLPFGGLGNKDRQAGLNLRFFR